MHDRDKSRNGCATSTATLVSPTYLATNDPKWMNESSKKFCADESPEDILANHEDTAEWRVLYEDMTAVTALTEYYLMKFELRRRSTNMEQYYGKRGACCNDVVDSDSVRVMLSDRSMDRLGFILVVLATNYWKGEVLRRTRAFTLTARAPPCDGHARRLVRWSVYRCDAKFKSVKRMESVTKTLLGEKRGDIKWLCFRRY